MSEAAKLRTKQVVKEGSRISAPYDFFDDPIRNELYYGRVICVVDTIDEPSKRAVKVKWEEDGEILVELLDELTLVEEKSVGKFKLKVKLLDSNQEDDVEFAVGSSEPAPSTSSPAAIVQQGMIL